MAPSFELALTPDSLSFGIELFLMKKALWWVGGGVLSTFLISMSQKSGYEIRGVTDIVGLVGAAEYVDKPMHGLTMTISFSLFKLEDALRRSRFAPLLRAFDAFAITLLWPAMSK